MAQPATIEGNLITNDRPLAVEVQNDVLAVDGPLTDAELRATAVPVDVEAELPAGTQVIGAVQMVDEVGASYGVQQVDNKLRTSSMPFLYDVCKGIVPNHYPFRRFGHNPTVGTSVETLWEYSTVYTYTTAAATMYISSSALADTQVYKIQGLDANWDVQTQLVTAVGRTKTEIGTGLTWMRILSVVNQGATANAGVIYVYENDTVTNGVPDTPTKVRAAAGIGEGQAHLAIWSVPNDQVAYVVTVYGSEVQAKATYFSLHIREFGGVFRYLRGWAVLSSSFLHQFSLPIPLEAKTDIEMRVETTVGSGVAQGGFDGWREDV